MATANSRYGRVERGDSIPYGTLASASDELKAVYYGYGIRNDDDWHALPTWGPDPAEVEADPTEVLFRQELVQVIRNMLDGLGGLPGLTPREAKVLRMRYGIEVNTDYTLDEIGRCFDVTRERIRQIEAKAMRTFRTPFRSNTLRPLIENDPRWAGLKNCRPPEPWPK
jgi:hypothetical protein